MRHALGSRIVPVFLALTFALSLGPETDGAAQATVESTTQPLFSETVDVLVYSATPAGIAAALGAGRDGSRVLLVEPTDRIGGLVTNGLSHVDVRTFEAFGGTYLELIERVEAYYRDRYGPDSPQLTDCQGGTHAEPKVNLRVLREMLAEVPRIRVAHGLSLVEVGLVPTEGRRQRIETVAFRDGLGKPFEVTASMVIDASYEGDLMALADVPYRVGREGRAEFGEPLAPEVGDDQVQGYNFRLTMTPEPSNRVAAPKPEGYRREDHLGLLDLFESGQVTSVFCEQRGGIYKTQRVWLPNRKRDINDVSRAPVRLSMPELSDDWPDGDAETRRRIFEAHLRHNVGMLYFLQNDPAVPERFRDEARDWGFCRDEFVDNGHLPTQLYIREARRMVGLTTFTQADVEHAPGDARAVHHIDAIAMGDYGPNCHGTAHDGPRFGGRHTGEFYHPAPPYQIPYGVLVPHEVGNLLVPVACSSSHVGFCALRLEPIWTSLGQAAGHAASQAIDASTDVQQIDVVRLQRRLRRAGAQTIYVSDVLPGADDFEAVQWWGTVGGLHGLEPEPERPGQRGPNLYGQYHAAFPGHAADLERELDPETERRWLELADQLGLPAEDLEDAPTRGEFIRRAHQLSRRRVGTDDSLTIRAFP